MVRWDEDMSEFVRVTANNGLRLRDSPRDGITLEVLPDKAELMLLGRETWLRVSRNGKVGFVLADHVEPMHAIQPALAPMPAPAVDPQVPPYTQAVDIIEYHPQGDVFRGSPLRIDKEFRPCIELLGGLALNHGIKIFVTSSLREPGKPVANAIVKPAQFSNHHVGHAIDMNLLDGDRLIRSDELGNPGVLGNSSPRAHAFLMEVRRLNRYFRWGGDFTIKDPVHIDNGLNVFHEQAFAGKLHALWGITRV